MKKLIYIFILLFSITSFSQQEASKWYFGRNAALDFSSGNPIPISGSELNTDEGCSSFADSSGNLLFYIGANPVFPNNLTVWDRNDNPMPNASPALGTGLEGDVSSSQAALTVPAPGNPNLFYIFTLGALSSGNSGFFYYELDMTLNGGLGDISAGPFDLSDGNALSWSEKVTAVKGDDCNTFWVISFVQNRFYAYKVDDIIGVAISSPVISVLNNAPDVRGYLKISPDGTKLVSANMGSGTFLYDFDNVTGVVSNPQTLNLSGNTGYGVEFSLSSQKLYISTGDFASGSQENLYQFDVSLPTIANINTSRELIHTYINARGALQMASNGKIYRASRDSARISVINNPEETGAASNYSHQTVDLGGPISSDGLPPFISSLLLPLEITESGSTVPLNNQIQNLCNGTDITFTPEPVAGSPTYVWTFDNGTSVVELSNGSSPNLTLTTINNTNDGIYKLTVTVIDECGIPTTLEGEFTIEVFDQPTAVQPSNMVQCDDDNNGTIPFMLTDQDAIINTDAGMSITYYLSQVAADAGTVGTELSSPFETGSTTIFARVENVLNTPCYDTTSFGLEVYATAFPSTTVSLLAACDNDSVGTDTDGLILFNLHDRATEILNGQAAADFTLTYFTDAAFTTQIPVADEIAFTNTIAGGQTIFVRMTNNLNTAICFADTSFEIEVFELPVLLTNSITLIQCNDDLTLIEAFNLRLKEDEISADFSSETFTYYETSAEANAGIAGTEIPNPTTYPNQIAGFDTVWVRVETINGCHRVAQVDLDVNPSSAVMTGFVTQIFSECDDPTNTTDVVSTFDFSSVTTDI
ncbi:MAG: hypothetical protein L3J14_08455, partial [Flavobacteriaceae bacterium]|nr:hypothetical protein [Flavobacteriaceae bacterium]